ncbi:hypothetical protein QQ045_022572 [Rhodiola kirilowii]
MWEFDPEGKGKGLRAHSKSQLDEILGPSECTYVSSLKNELVDSYVLSESSLFVNPYKVIIKTCGLWDYQAATVYPSYPQVSRLYQPRSEICSLHSWELYLSWCAILSSPALLPGG